jgi:hypothetical protein
MPNLLLQISVCLIRAPSTLVDPEVKYCGWHLPAAELTHQKGAWREPQRSWTADRLLKQIRCNLKERKIPSITLARKAPTVSLSRLAHWELMQTTHPSLEGVPSVRHSLHSLSPTASSSLAANTPSYLNSAKQSRSKLAA